MTSEASQTATELRVAWRGHLMRNSHPGMWCHPDLDCPEQIAAALPTALDDDAPLGWHTVERRGRHALIQRDTAPAGLEEVEAIAHEMSVFLSSAKEHGGDRVAPGWIKQIEKWHERLAAGSKGEKR